MPSEKEKILVVDDDLIIRELLHDLLTDEGFSVEMSPDGESALKLIHEHNEIVILFTDILMPEIDGITLIHKAKEINRDIVPIIMTGYATIETARAAIREGAYDYVLKPFNITEIKNVVNNALERNHLVKENARLKEITKLFKISENISSMQDEEQLFRFILNAALEYTQARRGSILMVTEDGENLNLIASVGLPEELNRKIIPINSSTISGLVVKNIEPLLIEDTNQNTELKKYLLGLKNNSFISVPLQSKKSEFMKSHPLTINGQDVIAVLNITDKSGDEAFSETDLKILKIIANHGAAAIENARLINEIDSVQREIVFTLGEIVETRSRETGSHVKRVAEYSKMLALKMGLSTKESEILRLASPLHDVGKVGIPDAILNKPGTLSPAEFEVIKTHTNIGYDMLRKAKSMVLQSAAIIALEHHERFDGNGYPTGKKGKDIHIFGRIVGIADVFDALGVERVYKKAWMLDEIKEYFSEQRGKQFDPDLVDIFFSNIEEFLLIQSRFPEDTKLAS
ncbi:MAG TPA: response regulator [Candidatus Hydrogenedens sp.]|nr:response regulator [Candidatus Hydrogenedens sp.]